MPRPLKLSLEALVLIVQPVTMLRMYLRPLIKPPLEHKNHPKDLNHQQAQKINEHQGLKDSPLHGIKQPQTDPSRRQPAQVRCLT